jgi:hypothetical protein
MGKLQVELEERGYEKIEEEKIYLYFNSHDRYL